MRINILVYTLALLLLPVFCLADDSIPITKDERYIINESYKYADDAQNIVSDLEDKGLSIVNYIDSLSLPTKAHVPSELALKPLPVNKEQNWWWNLFKKGKLNMKDTTVIYPKFLKFCVDVYNWADVTFNSYDPEYVVGTGKRWKARIVSDNWVDSYSMTLPQGLHTWMLSNLYSNIGAYIQYMAVSIGSSYDVGKLFNHHEPTHKKYEFGFNCARFNAELYYHENTGGTNLRKFGHFNNGKLIKEAFPGVTLYTFGIDAYYFFNNKKYSQGAAYNFSKIQKKNQGSFLLGFSWTNQKLSFDFQKLPDNLKPYLTIPENTRYLFHYNSYAILFGYGYNVVLLPQLLFNVTAMPAIGISHCYKDSLEGDKIMASLNISGRMSLTYNLGNYFFSIIGKMKGQWYKSGNHSLYSSIENFSANVGLRF